MPKIRIPDEVSQGFAEISLLSKSKAEAIGEYLNSIPLTINYNRIFEELNQYLASDLQIESSELIVDSIVSFSDLIKSSDFDSTELANNLTESYDKDFNSGVPNESLKENLAIILKKTERLGIIMRAVDLAYANDKIFNQGKVFSDLRIIFDENVKETNRHAIILHKLHIKYTKYNKREDAFFTMDLDDMQALKASIDSAIKNHESLKADYQKTLNII